MLNAEEKKEPETIEQIMKDAFLGIRIEPINVKELVGTAKQCAVIFSLKHINYDDLVKVLSQDEFNDCRYQSGHKIKKKDYIALRIGVTGQRLYTEKDLKHAFSDAV